MENNNEPVVTAGSIAGAVSAILALVVAFGLDLTADQTAAILGVVAVVAPVVAALIARKFTVSYNRVVSYEPKDSNAVVAGGARSANGL